MIEGVEVERLARLLYEDRPGPVELGWEKEYGPLKDHFRAKARRFIEKMAEPPKPEWPTDESVEVWWDTESGSWCPEDREAARELMRTALLADPIIKAAVSWANVDGPPLSLASVLYAAVRDAGLLKQAR